MGKILEVNSPPVADMTGKNVAVLHFRDYDAYVVAQNDGHVVRNVGYYTFNEDVVESIRRLRRGEVDGIAMDKWTVSAIPSLTKQNGISEDDIPDVHFLMRHCRAETLNYKGERLAYGILVRDKELYDYLEPFMKSNRMLVSIEDACDWTRQKIRDLDNNWKIERGSGILFSIRGRYFQGAMIGFIVLIVLMICFGVCFEGKRRSVRR